MRRDLYLQRQLNCHRRGWASKNSTKAGRQAGRQPTLPLSPPDLISPGEALTTSAVRPPPPPPPLPPSFFVCARRIFFFVFFVWRPGSSSVHPKHGDALFIVGSGGRGVEELLASAFMKRKCNTPTPPPASLRSIILAICPTNLLSTYLAQQWKLVVIICVQQMRPKRTLWSSLRPAGGKIKERGADEIVAAWSRGKDLELKNRRNSGWTTIIYFTLRSERTSGSTECHSVPSGSTSAPSEVQQAGQLIKPSIGYTADPAPLQPVYPSCLGEGAGSQPRFRPGHDARSPQGETTSSANSGQIKIKKMMSIFRFLLLESNYIA